MKSILLSLVLFFSMYHCVAQEIINIVLVGDEGVTTDIKKTKAFIIIKKFPDGFQRLDYLLHAPLQKVQTYSDSTLSILQGGYYEYDDNGRIALRGDYLNGQKNGSWYHYNDTAKVVLEEVYNNGVLLKAIDPDTVKKDKSTDLKDGEREAEFKNGQKNWRAFLIKNLNTDVTMRSEKGGEVRVRFVINIQGKCVDAYLQRSAEFVLDEEALRLINSSPLWVPALQNGKPVNAYRCQPITFMKNE